MADLSDNESQQEDTTSTISPQELNEDLLDRRCYRRFRNFAFWGACAVITSYFVAFLVALYFMGEWLHTQPDLLLKDSWHLWLICLVILAAVPTTVLLALLRFAFKEKYDEKNDKKDLPGIWLQLAREITDVAKDYIRKKWK